MPGGQSLLCCGVESCKRETSVRIQLVRLPDLLKGEHLRRERFTRARFTNQFEEQGQEVTRR